MGTKKNKLSRRRTADEWIVTVVRCRIMLIIDNIIITIVITTIVIVIPVRLISCSDGAVVTRDLQLTLGLPPA